MESWIRNRHFSVNHSGDTLGKMGTMGDIRHNSRRYITGFHLCHFATVEGGTLGLPSEIE